MATNKPSSTKPNPTARNSETRRVPVRRSFIGNPVSKPSSPVITNNRGGFNTKNSAVKSSGLKSNNPQLPWSSTLLAKQNRPTAQVGFGSGSSRFLTKKPIQTVNMPGTLNRKILEARTFPRLKKSTQRLPDFQVTHQPATRTNRTARKPLDKDLDQENKNVNMPRTSAVPVTRRRAPAALASKNMEIQVKGNKGGENKTAVAQTGRRSEQVISARRKVEEGSVKPVYSVRQSVRFLKKNVGQLSLKGEVKMKDDFQDKKKNSEGMELEELPVANFYDSIYNKVVDGGMQCTTGANQKNLESTAKVVDGAIPFQAQAQEVTELHLDLERDSESSEADSDEFLITECGATDAFPSDTIVNKYPVSEKTLSDGLDMKDAVEKVIYVVNVLEKENLDPNVEIDKFDTEGLVIVSLIQTEVPLPSKKNISFSKSATDSILKDKTPSTASLAGNEKMEFRRPSRMIRDKQYFNAHPLNKKDGTAGMHARPRLTGLSEPHLETAHLAELLLLPPSSMIAPKLEIDYHKFKACPLNKKVEEGCTRKSVKFLEQSISQLSLKDEGKAEPVRTDVSGGSEEKDVSEGIFEKNNSDDSSVPIDIEVLDNDMVLKGDFQDKKKKCNNGDVGSQKDKTTGMHARPILTIPREPDLETAHRAERIRPSNMIASKWEGDDHNFKASPLNKKVLSSKGAIGVFRSIKRETTKPKVVICE